MNSGYVLIACEIGVQQVAVTIKFIYFLVGSKPPVAVGSNDDIVDMLVVHVCQFSDSVILLVQDISSVKRPNDDPAACLGQAYYVVAAQQVGMLGIAAKHTYLPSVIAAYPSTFGSIPEVALTILKHLLHPV